MTLPKQQAIRYEIVIPSSGKKHRFRPFTVREEKAFLIAQQSEDLTTMIETLKNVIEACLEPKIESETLASFDLEYIMLMLRTKSVGENIRLQFKCDKCENPDPIYADIDMTQIKVQRPEGHTNNISLFDDVGVIMKYPSIHEMDQMIDVVQDPLKVFDLVTECLEMIYDGQELFHVKEQTKQEVEEFLYDLTKEQFAKIADFFITMPRVEHEVAYKCPACGHDHEKKVKGFSTFF